MFALGIATRKCRAAELARLYDQTRVVPVAMLMVQSVLSIRHVFADTPITEAIIFSKSTQNIK